MLYIVTTPFLESAGIFVASVIGSERKVPVSIVKKINPDLYSFRIVSAIVSVCGLKRAVTVLLFLPRSTCVVPSIVSLSGSPLRYL